MLLVVDNGSIFIKNITDFLSSIQVQHYVKTFDDIDILELNQIDSVILSGRRRNNQDMNATNSKIIQNCILEKKPLLGICYGAEILALTVGGTIRRMPSLQKGHSIVQIKKNNPLCGGIIDVYQSHNFEISQLGKHLTQIADSNYCKYEIIQYEELQIYGTQFHPEMSTDGLQLLEKFTKL